MAVETLEIEFIDQISGPAKQAGLAMLALTTAATAAIAKMAEFAIEVSEAKGDLIATLEALGGFQGAGQQLFDTIRQVAGVVPQSEAQLATWSEQLLAAGVNSDKLADALKAVSGAALLVKGGGDKVSSLIAKLNEASLQGTKIKFSTSMLAGTGITEEELMKAMGMTPKQLELAKKQGTLTGTQISDALIKVLGEKGGPRIESDMMNISTTVTKLKDDFKKLFEDVNVEPFAKALKDLASFFSQDTKTGQGLKMMLTGFFNKLFEVAAKVLPYIKRGLLLIMIGVLQMYVILKPAIAKFGELWDKITEGKSGPFIINELTLSIQRGAFMLSLFVNAVMVGLSALEKLFNWYDQAKGAAQNLTQGLVDGITSGTGWVIDAIRGMGQSAIDSLKSVLHIASPSKVFAKMGHFTAQGLAVGLDQGSGKVEASAGKLGGAAAGGAAGALSGGTPVKGGLTVNVQSGAINITGANGDAASLTETSIALMFERIALTQGLVT